MLIVKKEHVTNGNGVDHCSVFNRFGTTIEIYGTAE